MSWGFDFNEMTMLHSAGFKADFVGSINEGQTVAIKNNMADHNTEDNGNKYGPSIKFVKVGKLSRRQVIPSTSENFDGGDPYYQYSFIGTYDNGVTEGFTFHDHYDIYIKDES